eukprot:14188035-Alexandrium_andersonii.AAC.1
MPAGGHGGRVRRQRLGRSQHGRQRKPALDVRRDHLRRRHHRGLLEQDAERRCREQRGGRAARATDGLQRGCVHQERGG